MNICYPTFFFQPFNFVNSFINKVLNFISSLPWNNVNLRFEETNYKVVRNCRKAASYTLIRRNCIQPIFINVLKDRSQHHKIFFWDALLWELISGTFIFTNALYLRFNSYFLKNTCKVQNIYIYLLKYEPFKQKIANSEKGKDNFLISFSSAKLNLLLY